MAGPTITPQQFNMYTAQITDIYRALEDELFAQIARRLKTPPEQGKDHVLQWKVEKMREMNMLNKETIAALAETTGLAKEAIESMLHEVGIKTIESVDEQVKVLKRTTLPSPNNFNALMTVYVAQTFRELDNYVNQTLITTNFGVGTVPTMYRKIVEETTAQVLAGNKTINQAVTDTVIKWQQQGINTGFVDKAGRTWHLEQYADTVLRSTVNRTYNELTVSRAQDYGLDLMRVSTKADARPACARIQGGVVSMSDPSSNPKYPSIYDFGYGKPDGIRGINCSHSLFIFVDGVSENNSPQFNEDDAVNRYEDTQKQRYYERRIRESKRALKTAEITGDEVAIAKYRKQVRERQAKVREFISEKDLPRRYDKERVIT